VQLSDAVTLEAILGTIALQFAPADMVKGAGHETCGGVESTTLTVVVHELPLPAASVTVTVTVCDPTPTEVPAAGLCDLVSEAAGVQASEAVTLLSRFGIAA
jgi:hypothetical protein